uniref:EOG090X0GIP n=1 Tax=Lynceus sp. MCZ IZ 141354 TaxID=1930659 RepID=A0A9N6ZEU0_9CRUS|nr:EOG090X0GIP [Lynceus sp. MCZ IZ 141354]
MEVLYHQSQRLLIESQNLLPRLETATTGEEVKLIEESFTRSIGEITNNCEKLNIMVNKELPARRREARLRVEQLKQDRTLLINSFQALQKRREMRLKEHSDRELLLNHRFTSNRDTTLYIDQSLAHHTSMQNANHGLDDLLGAGSAILDNLRSQRTSLKGAHKRLLDLANTLGLSNTVMRFIEKRTSQDRYILYGGMFLVSLLIIAIFYYL